MFTDKQIKGLKHPAAGQYDVFEGGKIKAFGIRVGKKTKTFFVSVRINGKPERITIGQYDPDAGDDVEQARVRVTLKQARDRAYEIISDAQAGIRPETKKKRDEKGTFGAVAEAFMTDYASKHRSRYDMQRRIDKDLAGWRDRQIADITRADAKGLLREKARTAPISANRLHALISKIGVWCVKEDILDANPFANIDRPGGSETDRQRERNLSPDEIRCVWMKGFDQLAYPFGAAFKLLLVTGQRRGEVGGMRWSEITEEGWRIPNEKAKSGKGHLVPLSSLAREILDELPRRGDCVFGATSHQDTPPQSWSRAKAQIGDVISDWHTHDLRRTCATQLRSLGVDRLVVSKLLNHAEGGVTRIYDRYLADPEKAAAMERWANRLREIISGAPADNVVQMSRG